MREGREQRIELAPGVCVAPAAVGDGEAADGFDEREDRLAFLLPHGVAQHLAEEADVREQRFVLAVAARRFAHAGPVGEPAGLDRSRQAGMCHRARPHA
jgi:hypothetical protein